MKRIIVFIALIIYFLGINVYGCSIREISEKELTDIYTVALDSFMPESNLLKSKSYIAIDMNTPLFEKVSLEQKHEILDYFENKYRMVVINASFDDLKAIGLASGNYDSLKSEGKYGVLLMINNVNLISDNEAIVDGWWFTSTVSAEFYKSTIILRDKEWVLKEKIMTGFS